MLFTNPDEPIEKRIHSLINELTVDEKIGLLYVSKPDSKYVRPVKNLCLKEKIYL